MGLVTWVMVSDWSFLDRYEPERFLDRVGEAGVRNVAFGASLPLEPNPTHYVDSPIRPRPLPAEVLAYRARVEALFAEAQRRSINLYAYGTCPHMTRPHDAYRELAQKMRLDDEGVLRVVESYWGACANGPTFLPYYLGRVRDAASTYPMLAGLLNDGPEFGYEIAPTLMGGNWDLFACFGPCCAARAAALGHDWAHLLAAATHLRAWLRSLDERRLAATAARLWERRAQPDSDDITATDALAEACGDPAVRAWFQFRADSVATYVTALRAGVAAAAPAWRLGVGSRTAAFAPMTGYDQARVAREVDLLLPKLYFWMGGYDGLYGTIFRWADTLRRWNPGLAETTAMEFVAALFGFRLPGVRTAADLTRHIDAENLHTVGLTRAGDPFPDAFYAETVADEVRRSIRRIGDPARVVPWVSLSHGGRTMTARELDLLLSGAAAGGLTHYLYYGPIEGDEWAVARAHARHP